MTNSNTNMNRAIHRSVTDLVSELTASTNHPYDPKAMKELIEQNPLRSMSMGTDLEGRIQLHYFYVAPMIIKPKLDYIKHIADLYDEDEDEITLDSDTIGKNLPDGNRPEIVDYLFVTPPTITVHEVNTVTKMRSPRVIAVEGTNHTRSLAYDYIHNVYSPQHRTNRRNLCISEHADTNDATRMPDIELSQNYISHFFTDYANNDLRINLSIIEDAARRLGLPEWETYLGEDSIDIYVKGEYYDDEEEEWYDIEDTDRSQLLGTTYVAIYHLQRAFFNAYYPDLDHSVPSLDLIKAGADFWHVLTTPELVYNPREAYLGQPTGDAPRQIEDTIFTKLEDELSHVIIGEDEDSAMEAIEFDNNSLDVNDTAYVKLIDRENNDDLLATLAIHRVSTFTEDGPACPMESFNLSQKGSRDLATVVHTVLKRLGITMNHDLMLEFDEDLGEFKVSEVNASYSDNPIRRSVSIDEHLTMSVRTYVVYLNAANGVVVGNDRLEMDLPMQMVVELRSDHFYNNAKDRYKQEIEDRSDYTVQNIERINSSKILVTVNIPEPTEKSIHVVFASPQKGVISREDVVVAADYDIDENLDEFTNNLLEERYPDASIINRSHISSDVVLIDITQQ